MSKKIYFASDFHLGIDAQLTSVEREKKIVRWLDEISDEVKTLYLVGDIFDHWFEYKKVVPKGFIRLLGKLHEMRDANIDIHFFTGNHDMWMFRYFYDEMGIPIHRKPISVTLEGKNFFIGHGDGLGPGDYGYKCIKYIFNAPSAQWAFRQLHPDVGLRLMRFFSAQSRQMESMVRPFNAADEEWLVQFVEAHSTAFEVDYYVFGHRHLPIHYVLTNGRSKYINLGEWMFACSYGVWDGHHFELKFFDSTMEKIYGSPINLST